MKSALAALLVTACALAQPDKPKFEEAAIKLAPSDGQTMVEPMPGGGLRIEGMSLKTMITWAYQIQNYQLSGGPAWAENERWNVIAKAPAPADASAPLDYDKMNDTQRSRMMNVVQRRTQSLLAERFHLELRRESREQTVYALVIAKGGPKLKESADQSKSGMLLRRRGVLDCRGCQLEAAMQFLAVDVERPVLNRTGLTAHYDFKLEWTPEGPAGAESGAPGNPGPTVFTAIQELLGLKLESQKAPVEMLVIERAEKPEN